MPYPVRADGQLHSGLDASRKTETKLSQNLALVWWFSNQFSVFSFQFQRLDQAMQHGKSFFELGEELAALLASQDTDAFSNQFSVVSFQFSAFSFGVLGLDQTMEHGENLFVVSEELADVTVDVVNV